jgi:hydroxyacylglutathione hydrolase
MDVRMFTVGPVAENTYIFRHEGSDRALIVDPGDEPDKLLGAVDALGVTLEGILLTHTHFDHVGAVAGGGGGGGGGARGGGGGGWGVGGD